MIVNAVQADKFIGIEGINYESRDNFNNLRIVPSEFL